MPIFGKVTAEKWQDLSVLSEALGGYIFRGHARSSWVLETRLERFANYCKLNGSSLVMIEREMINQFRNRSSIHLGEGIPPKGSYLDWLAMMQHYGAPTRLLDFSHSLFIAAYFSVAAEVSSDSAVWAINYRHLLELISPESKKIDNRHLDAYAVSRAQGKLDGLINDRIILHSMMPMFVDDDPYWGGRMNGVVPAEPQYYNRRLLRQRGIFLLPINVTTRFSENIADAFCVGRKANTTGPKALSVGAVATKPCPPIIKIEIPERERYRFLKILLRMGITAESLFPGMDGLARSLVEPIYTVSG